MKTISATHRKRKRRTHRVRAKISGVSNRPRLTIARSNRAIAAQLIDDSAGKTLATASTRELSKQGAGLTKTDAAYGVGELIAKKAKAAGITKVVFDRRSYAYHGRVKAVAEGARKGGLTI